MTEMEKDENLAIRASHDVEAAALADIVEWSNGCPPWQRDALRRLCIKDALDSNDFAELTALCKDGSAAIPLGAEHVRSVDGASSVVTLKSIHSVQHVNALALGESLTFCKAGVTVIYGDNGSGKSGYARILKQACRARSPRGETILPNIYGVSGERPSATIDFSVGGATRSTTWHSNQPADAMLSAVSVFDSHTANIHVDNANDLAYTPLPLQLLAKLAEASQEVKSRLSLEVAALQQQTPAIISRPACQPGTQVGKLMSALANAKPECVTALATMSDKEKARLAVLKADLSADPTQAGQALQAQKAKIDGAIRRLVQLVAALGDANVDAVRSAHSTLLSARHAALAASANLFSGEALPEIGSDAWRSLWEAARKYSELSAYPDLRFPVTDAGARCVLCLQQLESEASMRLAAFEAFVKDETKQQEALAQEAYDAVLADIDSAAMQPVERVALQTLLESELGEADLAAEVASVIETAMVRLQALREGQMDSDKLPKMPTLQVSRLKDISASLQHRAAGLLAEGDSEERKKLTAERDELADRCWLSGIKDDAIAEIGRQQKITALHKAKSDAASNRATTKSGDVASKLVTDTLRVQFAKEVERLDVAGLAIELRQEPTAHGVPRFRVRFSKKPDATVGAVLSEGEHRCVALAAFLAEMATTDTRSGIVFDDPVSSLDHKHREAIANRLADEGKLRQIVVFTHDISFLFLIYEGCRDAGTSITFRSINRGTDFAGFCQPNPPPNAQPVEKVIESMRKHLENSKIQFERGQQAAWYQTVRSLQEQLRTTWERAVEDAVSPVIRRLANKVYTPGLPKLTVLTMEDCRVMRDAFGRCSALLHSTPQDLNPPLPNPYKIETEIQALESWVDDIRNRQRSIKITDAETGAAG